MKQRHFPRLALTALAFYLAIELLSRVGPSTAT